MIRLAMPEVVTHRYDPVAGVGLNVCSLPDAEASRVIDRVRREFRPSLKPDYLARRRTTERWLAEAAAKLLVCAVQQHPVYFFLGDFCHGTDASRPAALVIPLSQLPGEAITFSLGDSTSVAARPERRLYLPGEMVTLFATDPAMAEFGLTDRQGLQSHYIELQLWDASVLRAYGSPVKPAPGVVTESEERQGEPPR